MKKTIKKILLGVLEFLQESDGGNSSRRLIFVYGGLIAIPLSYYYGYKTPELFDLIHNSNLWFLGALGGLTTADKILKKFEKNDK